eukprot:COSAG06_NODE_16479_length_998_cov_3.569522_2_plen_93_part_01
MREGWIHTAAPQLVSPSGRHSAVGLLVRLCYGSGGGGGAPGGGGGGCLSKGEQREKGGALCRCFCCVLCLSFCLCLCVCVWICVDAYDVLGSG